MTLIYDAHLNRDTHYIVEEMKREIRKAITVGEIPQTIGSFSELHDYIDANELGGFCIEAIADLYYVPEGLGIDCTMINECQNAIDVWLKAGMPAG